MSSIEFIFLLQILKIVIEDLKYRGAGRTVVIVSRGPRQNYLDLDIHAKREGHHRITSRSSQ